MSDRVRKGHAKVRAEFEERLDRNRKTGEDLETRKLRRLVADIEQGLGVKLGEWDHNDVVSGETLASAIRLYQTMRPLRRLTDGGWAGIPAAIGHAREAVQVLEETQQSLQDLQALTTESGSGK